MGIPWLPGALVAALLVPVGGVPIASSAPPGPRTEGAASAPSMPTLVAVRALHRGDRDRVVFEFRGGLPAEQEVGYVDRLVADGSGRRVHVAGRAVLRVRFEPARAHTAAGASTGAPRRAAFALPNVMTAVRSGDFEGVTTYGIGLAKRTPVRVSTLRSPDRVVVEVGAGFRTVERRVWFFHRQRFLDNREPFFVPVTRPVRPRTPATGVMDRLFAGPVAGERARGLRLLRSGAVGYRDLVVADSVARVRLLGGCSSRGSTVTIAGEVLPTLHQFPAVERVVLEDPRGTTQDPDGPGDSTPACLEP